MIFAKTLKRIFLFPLLFLLVTCATLSPYTNLTRNKKFKTVQDQIAMQESVAIDVWCTPEVGFEGSGFAVSPSEVITANHVVECKDLSTGHYFGGPMVIIIKLHDGRKFPMKVENYDSAMDTALLQTKDKSTPFKSFPPKKADKEHSDRDTYISVINTADPNIGDTLCTWSGLHHKQACGKVLTVTPNKIYVDIKVIPGDSGSLVYNPDTGEVIAFVDARIDYILDGKEIHQGIFIKSASWKYLIPSP